MTISLLPKHSIQFLVLTLLSLFFSTLSAAPATFPVKDKNQIIFAYGSCNYQRDPTDPVYNKILKHNPDIWVWLGDAIYIRGNDVQDPIGKYNYILANPNYQNFKSKIPVIGTWDDHDCGPNNADKTYIYKERNRQLYLDFLGEPKNSPRRGRDGVYESYYLGDEKTIKVILLDVRYNRDERMIFNSSKDILGEQQWEWLENEFKMDSPVFTIIGSGTQVISDDRIYAEVWYTASRERLFKLIRKYKRSGVILLSGDVHYAEIMKYPCSHKVGYNLYEFGSSGITHYLWLESIVNTIYPTHFNGPEDRYYGRHYTTLKFSFDGEKPSVTYETWHLDGKKVLEKKVSYEELEFNENIVDESGFCVVDTNPLMRFFMHFFAEAMKGTQVVLTISIALIGLFSTLICFCILNRKPKMRKQD